MQFRDTGWSYIKSSLNLDLSGMVTPGVLTKKRVLTKCFNFASVAVKL